MSNDSTIKQELALAPPALPSSSALRPAHRGCGVLTNFLCSVDALPAKPILVRHRPRACVPHPISTEARCLCKELQATLWALGPDTHLARECPLPLVAAVP